LSALRYDIFSRASTVASTQAIIEGVGVAVVVNASWLRLEVITADWIEGVQIGSCTWRR